MTETYLKINLEVCGNSDGYACDIHSNDYDNQGVVRSAKKASDNQGGTDNPETYHNKQDPTNCDHNFETQV